MAQRSNALKTLDTIAVVLLIIGGLNWGLVGLFGFDLVGAPFGPLSWFSRLIYVLVGAAALYRIFMWRPMIRRQCETWHGPAQRPI